MAPHRYDCWTTPIYRLIDKSVSTYKDCGFFFQISETIQCTYIHTIGLCFKIMFVLNLIYVHKLYFTAIRLQSYMHMAMQDQAVDVTGRRAGRT